jgi:N-acetylneuraminate synthase/N,N'-diacetyllegionaminate synthase
MVIGDRVIGSGAPCFVIAEAGVNHNGDLDLAKRLIDAAADAGADAVKFQTFRAAGVVAEDAPSAAYQRVGEDRDTAQYELLRRLELDEEGHVALLQHAQRRGIVFCSTPFDLPSVDLLERLGVPFFKIASGDLTYTQLLRRVASKQRPIVLSTGMADIDEVAAAVDTLSAAGAGDLALLHCVSEYPAPIEDANLRVIPAMAERFGLPVGLSDHTPGLTVAVVAVALGAAIIEKHFTLDRGLPGPDHRASLEPGDFAQLVREIRDVEGAMGTGKKQAAPSELANRDIVRRSVFVAVEVAEGAPITPDMLVCKRPGDGIPASDIDLVVGRRARRPISVGEKLTWESLA